MFVLFFPAALADIILLDPSQPAPPPCVCDPGRPEEVEVRADRKVESRFIDQNGNLHRASDGLRRLGYTSTCTRNRGYEVVWCGPKDALPLCTLNSCAAVNGVVAMRCPEGAACEAVQGATPQCRVWDEPLGKPVTVWCRPDAAMIVLPPEVPPTVHPGGCATGVGTMSGLGLALLLLAARRR